jgi:hypothetical protein
MGGNSESGAMAAMEGHKRIKIEVGEHIAVHDKESLVKAFDRRQGSSRSGGLFFIDIAQARLCRELRPVLEISFDELRQMTQGKGDVRDAKGDEAFYQHLYYRPIAEWHERLWKYHGERVKPNAFTACKHHRAHTLRSAPDGCTCSRFAGQTTYPPVS